MIWDKEECLSRTEIENIQLERLIHLVHIVYNQVPYYKNLFDQHNVKPDDLKSLADLAKLPFTTKAALRDNYPYGLFAKPLKEIVRLHASSGTTGKPIVVAYTKNDLNIWSQLVARMVTQAGVNDLDIVQIAFSYGLFTGGFGLHYGLEKAGATVVPVSVGNTEKQIMLMQDFKTTVLVSTPSYALYMAEVANSMGIDPKTLPLRLGLFGGEPWTENMRRQIEKVWNIKATDNYGLSEVMGPGVAGECGHSSGMHISEDHFIIEIIDPVTEKVLPPGNEGEVVITPLTKEAFPLIRYRTKDISVIYDEPCPCGRTTHRLRKVTGRTDDMLIIRGVNVFPSQIESVLMEIDGVAPYYQLIVERKGFLDRLQIQVELTDEKFTGSFKELEELEEKIKEKIKTVLSISAKIKLVEPRSLERTMGKAKRVIDNRPKDF